MENMFIKVSSTGVGLLIKSGVRASHSLKQLIELDDLHSGFNYTWYINNNVVIGINRLHRTPVTPDMIVQEILLMPTNEAKHRYILNEPSVVYAEDF